MELLRIHAEKYIQSSSQLAIYADLFGNDPEGLLSGDERSAFMKVLERMRALCSTGDLPVTHIPLQTLWLALSFSFNEPHKQDQSKRVVKHFLQTALDRLPDEMSTKMYFQLPHDRKELRGHARNGMRL